MIIRLGGGVRVCGFGGIVLLIGVVVLVLDEQLQRLGGLGQNPKRAGPTSPDRIGVAAGGQDLSDPVHRRQEPDQLAARQSALQVEAAALLDELEQSEVFSDIGPLEVTGSYISNLMCWRDLDVGLLVGADYSPRDVLHLISRVVDLRGVVGFDYRDERAERSSTGLVKEERYHVPILLDRGAGPWRLDLSLWLHDLHENVTAWHRALCSKITNEQRAAVLRIKDVWFGLPSYPDLIGGFDIYTAVIDDCVRTPQEFRSWLVDRELLEV